MSCWFALLCAVQGDFDAAIAEHLRILELVDVGFQGAQLRRPLPATMPSVLYLTVNQGLVSVLGTLVMCCCLRGILFGGCWVCNVGLLQIFFADVAARARIPQSQEGGAHRCGAAGFC